MEECSIAARSDPTGNSCFLTFAGFASLREIFSLVDDHPRTTRRGRLRPFALERRTKNARARCSYDLNPSSSHSMY